MAFKRLPYIHTAPSTQVQGHKVPLSDHPRPLEEEERVVLLLREERHGLRNLIAGGHD